MKTPKQDELELQRKLYYESEMKKADEFKAILIGGFSMVAIILMCIFAVILFKN